MTRQLVPTTYARQILRRTGAAGRDQAEAAVAQLIREQAPHEEHNGFDVVRARRIVRCVGYDLGLWDCSGQPNPW